MSEAATALQSSTSTFESIARAQDNEFPREVVDRSSESTVTRGGEPNVVSMSDLRAPDFSRYMGRSADFVLASARMSARQVDDGEVERLLSEHRILAHEKVMGRADCRQLARLEYVQWTLDRIDDAKSGPALDVLDSEVSLMKQLGEDLISLKRSIDRISGAKPRK